MSTTNIKKRRFSQDIKSYKNDRFKSYKDEDTSISVIFDCFLNVYFVKLNDLLPFTKSQKNKRFKDSTGFKTALTRINIETHSLPNMSTWAYHHYKTLWIKLEELIQTGSELINDISILNNIYATVQEYYEIPEPVHHTKKKLKLKIKQAPPNSPLTKFMKIDEEEEEVFIPEDASDNSDNSDYSYHPIKKNISKYNHEISPSNQTFQTFQTFLDEKEERKERDEIKLELFNDPQIMNEVIDSLSTKYKKVVIESLEEKYEKIVKDSLGKYFSPIIQAELREYWRPIIKVRLRRELREAEKNKRLKLDAELVFDKNYIMKRI